MIFIKFKDSDTNVVHHLDDIESVENAYKIYNSNDSFAMNTVNGMIDVPSFKSYYEKQSYGNLSITSEILPKINGKVVSYEDINPIAYYLKYSEENPSGYKNQSESLKRESELLNRAVAFVSSNMADLGITPQEVDKNGDGIIDAISFVIEGQKNLPSSIAWGDLLWSHKSDNNGITETLLGKNITAYNLLYAEDYTETAALFSMNRGTYGTIIHEFGHTLGYKDLYRHGMPNSHPVGFYDIMGNTVGSNPQNLLTYFISEYDTSTNWHSPIPEIRGTTNQLTLYKPNFSDPNEKRAIKIKTENSDDEYFIVEYHEQQNTYDSYRAESSGIIVYRVNEKNKYAGNVSGGDHGENDHIYIFRPNETSLGNGEGSLALATLNMKRPNLGKKLDLNQNTFDNESIFFSDGTNSGIQIKVTNETQDAITFDVIFPEFEGNGTKENPYLIRDVQTFFHLMALNTKGKYYQLMADLDFQNTKDYPMIEFEGNLNGNGKTIKNVTTKESGLFHQVGTYDIHTKIENLNVENLNVYAKNKDYLGGFADVTENVSLQNIHLKSGMIVNDGESLNGIGSTGGFVGNASNTVVIENCSSKLNVTAFQNVGGFIGINLNATIKNSFTQGTVNGTKNVGGFIGIQAITDSAYKIPVHAYYQNDEKEKREGVGGYVEKLHNLDVLDEASLAKGIISIAVSSELEMYLSLKRELPLTTTPNANLTYTVTFEHANILNYDGGKLTALNEGTTKMFIDVSIGTEKMRFTTSVIVNKMDGIHEENAILESLGLIKEEDYVFGFSLGMDIKDMKKNMLNHNVNVKSVTSSNQVELSSGKIATGMKLVLEFNHTTYHYTIVIKGDTNGDGLIYATDYVKVKNHIMGKSKLTGPYLFAADINRDGLIYATDYVQIKNHIMGKKEIAQK